MTEEQGDIWAYLGKAILAITTNGHVDRNGRAVIGRGVARQALQYVPDLTCRLGSLIQEHGNHVFDLGKSLVSFPVEDTPWSRPDLSLIARSAGELRRLADSRGWLRIVVPRPGCGGGGLIWSEVRPLLAVEFDCRFIVIGR